MRLRTQLFFGTALLVLALVAVQWWLQARQLKTIQTQLSGVAASVGQALIFGKPLPKEDSQLLDPALVKEIDNALSVSELALLGLGQSSADQEKLKEALTKAKENMRKAGIRVETREGQQGSTLVISGDRGVRQQVVIPFAPALESVQANLRRGLYATGLLLVLGLAAVAVISYRFARPLSELSREAEALGRGEFGRQVRQTAAGEVGQLQAAFNAMSRRLAELEAEKERWRAREQLAELGFVSRGLAHTLRNSLNTLGLVVEQLASRDLPGGQELIATAREQLVRIERLHRSFLALGAGNAAEEELVELSRLVKDVILELAQEGGRVELGGSEQALPVQVVPMALRSALSNLVANAIEASSGAPVQVLLERHGDEALIRILDSGPGLPEEVRKQLFQPHVTTKASGTGMGLFLARQLIETAHGGTLEILDRPEGGTEARVTLSLAKTPEHA